MKPRAVLVLLAALALAAPAAAWAQCANGNANDGHCASSSDAQHAPAAQDSAAPENTEKRTEKRTEKSAENTDSQANARAVWQDRWGAIVFDRTTGQAGSAADQPTQAQAEQIAFAKCLEYGSPNCKVILSYANQCAAVAASVTESGFAAGTTQEKAQTQALEQCGQDRGCRIVYSHCNVPGRTQ